MTDNTEPTIDYELQKILDDHNEKVKQASKKYDGYPVSKGNRELKQALTKLISDQVAKAYDRGYADKAIKADKELLDAVAKARISELKQLEPPEQYIDYAMISGNDACAICGFNAKKFSEHIADRIATLNGVKSK